MGKVDLKYVSQFTDRHGRTRTYFRFKGRRHALPDPADPGFMGAYKRLHGKLVGSAAVVTKGEESLGWLIGRYQAAPEFKALRESTRKEYARILSDIGMAHGTKEWRKLTYEKVLEHIRDSLAETPRKADTYVVVLSAVYSWAVGRRMTAENPCRGVPRLYQKGAGYRAWTRAEMEAFAAGATDDEYLIFALALYTGQRAGDLVRLTWFQWDGTGFRLTQSKTGSALYIPAHPALRTELERHKARSGTIIATPGDKASGLCPVDDIEADGEGVPAHGAGRVHVARAPDDARDVDRSVGERLESDRLDDRASSAGDDRALHAQRRPGGACGDRHRVASERPENGQWQTCPDNGKP